MNNVNLDTNQEKTNDTSAYQYQRFGKSRDRYQYIVDIILSIKKENQGYSPGMISRMFKSQLKISIHKKTVQAILKDNGYPPNPPGKIHPPPNRNLPGRR